MTYVTKNKKTLEGKKVNGIFHTLMTVDSTEALVTDAGEVSCWLTEATSSRTTDIGGDVPYSGRVIGRYSNSAAVNH